MNIFAIAPAIIPALSGWDSDKFSRLHASLQGRGQLTDISCELGNFGAAAEEFNLYTDITDAGADFKKYYALKLRIPIVQQDESFPAKLVRCVDPYIEIRIFDEMIAIATQVVDIDVDLIQTTFDGDRNLFDAHFVRHTSDVMRAALLRANALLMNHQVLSSSMEKQGVDLMKPKSLKEPQVGWVHKVFLVSELQSSALNAEKHRMRGIIATQTLNDWDGRNNFFGWGDSIKNVSASTDWCEGCILSQYFYFVLDRFNRRIPTLISDLRSGRTSKSLAETKSLGMDLRHRVTEKELAYADALHTVAGDVREPVAGYNVTWRFADLRKNLSSKLPILQDVLNEAQDKAQKRTNAIVEALLFFVSLMSLVGMFLSAHDYAAKLAKDKVSSSVVLVSMNPLYWADVLSLAVGVACIGLSIFICLRFAILQKIWRVFSMGLDKFRSMLRRRSAL